LRILSIRGLITRTSDSQDERAFTYEPSLELLKMLGIENKESLPDFRDVTNDIEGFITSQNKEIAADTLPGAKPESDATNNETSYDN
jgi:hypothetical protein